MLCTSTILSQKTSFVASMSNSASCSNCRGPGQPRPTRGALPHRGTRRTATPSPQRTPDGSSAARRAGARTRVQTSRGTVSMLVLTAISRSRSPSALCRYPRGRRERRSAGMNARWHSAPLICRCQLSRYPALRAFLVRLSTPKRNSNLDTSSIRRRLVELVVDRGPIWARSSHHTHPSVAHRCRRNSATCSFGRENTASGTNFSWLRNPNNPSSSSHCRDGVPLAAREPVRRWEAQTGASCRRVVVADRGECRTPSEPAVNRPPRGSPRPCSRSGAAGV